MANGIRKPFDLSREQRRMWRKWMQKKRAKRHLPRGPYRRK